MPWQRPFIKRLAGFTLIELMVGIVIGLLASLAVTQVLSMSEGQKRTTTSGSDAQVNGALALNTIQRTVQQAGYGFGSSVTTNGCTLTASFNGAAIAGFPTKLAPIVITPGANANTPDSIRVLASGKRNMSLAMRVVAPGYNPANPSLNTTMPVASSLGVQGPTTDAPGELLIVTNGADSSTPCEVFQATAAPTLAGIPRADDGAHWNSPGQPALAYGNGNIVFNMGIPVDRTFSVNTNTYSLQITQFQMALDSTPSYNGPSDLYPNIVNMKALYGKDTNADGVIDTWDNTTPTTDVLWKQVLAVRIALVARSSQYEKDVVTAVSPEWDVGTAVTVAGTATCSSGGGKCLSMGAPGTDWGHYRYKVFDTLIPLRNIIWNTSP